jgi:hypothetical protein
MFGEVMRAFMSSLFLAGTVSLATLGCSSGQTGSPDCIGPTSCICDPLYSGGKLVRVRAERVESGRLEGTVQQTFTSSYGAASDVMEGDRIGGSQSTEQPCNRGAGRTIRAGTELLVLYGEGRNGGYPNCPDFPACASAECVGLEEQALSDCWATCETRTEEVCAQHRNAALLDGHFLWAMPWQDPLDFGDSNRLSTSELDVLSSPEACLERFPADPAPPCGETSNQPRCIAAPPRTDSSGSVAWLLLSAGLLLSSVLRRALPMRSCAREFAGGSRAQGSSEKQ